MHIEDEHLAGLIGEHGLTVAPAAAQAMWPGVRQVFACCSPSEPRWSPKRRSSPGTWIGSTGVLLATATCARSAAMVSRTEMVCAVAVLMLELRAQDREEKEDSGMEILDLITGWRPGGDAVWRSMRPDVG